MKRNFAGLEDSGQSRIDASGSSRRRGVRSWLVWLLVVAAGPIGTADFLKLPRKVTDDVEVVPTTNSYHLSFAFDGVSNATGYQVIVRTNGVEGWRVETVTNFVTVSNLSPALDGYRFTVVATNGFGVSDESSAAVMRWMRVLESDSVNGPWVLLVTNEFMPSAPQHFIALTNWSAGMELKRD